MTYILLAWSIIGVLGVGVWIYGKEVEEVNFWTRLTAVLVGGPIMWGLLVIYLAIYLSRK